LQRASRGAPRATGCSCSSRQRRCRSCCRSGRKDASHWCFSRALAHGRLHDDGCFDSTGDRASYDGRLYSDKAPGLGALGVPVVEAVRRQAPSQWPPVGDQRLWAAGSMGAAGLAALEAPEEPLARYGGR
jgi:hypothetical protein